MMSTLQPKGIHSKYVKYSLTFLLINTVSSIDSDLALKLTAPV